MDERIHIQDIVDQALCVGCGACSGICPASCVRMVAHVAGHLVAQVDGGRCTGCGLCRRVCPSAAESPLAADGEDPFHGVCGEAWIGHATDARIRQQSQSGGIVSSLLCCLLDERKVDGAVVSRFCKETRRGECAWVSTREEVLGAAGSLYCQTPVAQAVLAHPGQRQAVVALGCQAESLRRIQSVRPDAVALECIIGLVCAGQYSGHYLDDLAALAGVGGRVIDRFRFKDKDAGGWPGNVKVYTAGEEFELDSRQRIRLKALYELYRCLLCPDQMNVHSDLVVGDPWGIAHPENRLGNSVVLVRTETGRRLVARARELGYIEVEPLSVERLFKGQTVDDRLKASIHAALHAAQSRGWAVPVRMKDGVPEAGVRCAVRQRREVEERLDYTRQINLARTAEQVEEVRNARRVAVRRTQRRAAAVGVIRRGIRLMLRRLGNIVRARDKSAMVGSGRIR